VVWGGQKVLFVFEHHSGEFGLYYDVGRLPKFAIRL
jgi:molecular chaperone HtpG